MRKLKLSLIAVIAFGSTNFANAGLFDFAKTTTETKEIFLIYDLPGFSSPLENLKDKVKESLVYRGDNAVVKEFMLTGESPKFPSKIEFKVINLGIVSLSIPSCPGSGFLVSSSDVSGASYGETAKYIACAFPYSGGYRVNFYASYVNSSGEGIMGISKALAKAVTGAVGINSSPQAFIETSIAKMEELFTASGWSYQIIEMRPSIAGKTLVEDPLVKQQAIEAKRGGDRTKRMAARAELSKLSIDANDRARLVKAIQTQDEDIVALFVEANAMDLSARDESGKQLIDYSNSPSIRALLPATQEK